jgi:hypothetical protein
MRIVGMRRVSTIYGAGFALCVTLGLAETPQGLVTSADIEEVLGSTTEADLLDDGQIVSYTLVDPATGSATTVQAHLELPDDWKQLSALRDAAEMGAEEYEEIAVLADAAVYRFRDDEGHLTVEKADAEGARTWLHLSVIDAGDAAAARRIATELGRRAARRL